MTYDPTLLTINRLYGTSKLDYGARMGEAVLDRSDNVREPVDVSRASIFGGYTIETGTLSGEETASLDPMQASANASGYVNDWDDALPLSKGDRVEISYAGVLNFLGSCFEVVRKISTDPRALDNGKTWRRDLTFKLASIEYDLFMQQVTFDALPVETPLTRLNRWFTVDTSMLSSAHLAYLETLAAPARDGATLALIDLARDFTSVTGVPVRVKIIGSDPTGPKPTLVVLDNAVTWWDQPLVPVVSNVEDWASSVSDTNGSPSDVTVIRDDTRFLGGHYSYEFSEQPMNTFRLDIDRLGPHPIEQVGYLAPDPVDVLGAYRIVSRITHTFDRDHYSCQLELRHAASIEV